MARYVWFYSADYQDGNAETGYLHSNSDEVSTAAKQLYDYLGEGYKIKSLQFNGKIVDIGEPDES